MKEGKSTERTRLEEQAWDPLFMTCEHCTPFLFFFSFNWPYFRTTVLQEEKPDSFLAELLSGRASTKPRSFEKATFSFNNAT